MAVPEFYTGKVLYPAITVLIGLSVLFGLAIMPRFSPRSPLVGKQAPTFVLPVAANGDAGARMGLEDLKGHPVVLDFWASWCGPCAIEAPVLDRLARRHTKRGLVVLGVNASDSPEVIRSYALQKGLSYPMVSDPMSTAASLYGVTQLPSLVVIDKAGRVLAYYTGVVDEASLDEVLATAM